MKVFGDFNLPHIRYESIDVGEGTAIESDAPLGNTPKGRAHYAITWQLSTTTEKLKAPDLE